MKEKTIANVKTNRETKNLELLITTKKTNPLLGLDWMRHLGIKLDFKKVNLKIQNVREEPYSNELKRKFKNLLHENKTAKGIEVDI